MTSPSPSPPSSMLLGYLCGMGFIAVWSGFIVFARAGVTSGMTAFDITAVRFMVGALITLPFAVCYWPRHLSLSKIFVLLITGPGMVYSMLMYSGLGLSPAAFAGVFSNATIPIFTAALTWFLLGERLTKLGSLAIAVILAGSTAVAYQSFSSSNVENLAGLPFFIMASVFLASYVVFLRMWKLTAKQTLAIINLPTAVLFLPIWYFFLPSTITTADPYDVVFQALFQGLGPGFIALVFFTYAIQTLGTTPVAGFAAVVPATAALLAIPVLGEHLNGIEWSGIVAVTIGLVLLIWRR